MKQLNTNLFRKITLSIKYGIVIGDVGFTLHCLLLLFGINTPILNFIFGLSLLGFIIMFLSTYLLGFCNLIRSFLVHGFLVKCCIEYEKCIGFGVMLIPLRWLMLLSGLVLLILLCRLKILET